MTTVQLLQADDGNQSALQSVLPDRYTLVTDDELRDADLYLLDEPSVLRYRDTIERQKEREAPVFCPVVMIRRDRCGVTVDLPDPVTGADPLLVDEILTAPVDKQTLHRSVETLLARRRQAVTLQQRTQQLEEITSALRHELRNPLGILKLSVEEARDADSQDPLDRCHRAIGRMERMLEETLLVVEREEVTIDSEIVSLPAVVEECWDIVVDPEATLDVRTDQCLVADSDRLHQLLSNLLRNAVEHGSTGRTDAGASADAVEHGSTGRTDAEAVEHGGDGVDVTVGPLEDGFYVEDDGPGIPSDERDRVFEEGYSTSTAGSGLGLAVVDAVVAAHGWDVTVTEGTDGGARFEIRDIQQVR